MLYGKRRRGNRRVLLRQTAPRCGWSAGSRRRRREPASLRFRRVRRSSPRRVSPRVLAIVAAWHALHWLAWIALSAPPEAAPRLVQIRQPERFHGDVAVADDQAAVADEVERKAMGARGILCGTWPTGLKGIGSKFGGAEALTAAGRAIASSGLRTSMPPTFST